MPVEIPLTTDPESLFRIKLDERQIDFRVIFNTRNETWTVDLSENNIDLVLGITLVLGTELLMAYNLDLGSLVMVDTEGGSVEATSESLGDRNILLFYTIAEIEALAV